MYANDVPSRAAQRPFRLWIAGLLLFAAILVLTSTAVYPSTASARSDQASIQSSDPAYDAYYRTQRKNGKWTKKVDYGDKQFRTYNISKKKRKALQLIINTQPYTDSFAGPCTPYRIDFKEVDSLQSEDGKLLKSVNGTRGTLTKKLKNLKRGKHIYRAEVVSDCPDAGATQVKFIYFIMKLTR